MFRIFLITFSMSLAVPAWAGGIDAAAINDAAYPAKLPSSKKPAAAVVKLQILLDRAHFSPGEIDGTLGDNARKALRAFAEARGSGSGTTLSPELWNLLTATTDAPTIVEYKITEADTGGPFLKHLPAKMEEMKGLKALSYRSPREGLSEKFHISEDLLAALNPGKGFDRPGEVILVPNVLVRADRMAISRVEIDKSRESVTALDAAGRVVAFFPATVGSSEKPTPSGAFKVTSTDPDPTYRYDPAYKFKGVKSRKPFTIRPGPNNPVGSFWIGLSAQGYGVHGTAAPDSVGKTASHGCVRLTNWDARFLGENIKRGTPVVFIDAPDSATLGSAR